MTLIVINADDYGYSDGICRSIYELVEDQAISGTSLMCAAEDIASRLRRWPVGDFAEIVGVHLQLTGGYPLSPIKQVTSLVDVGTGKFKDPRHGDPPRVDEVEIEWRRQILAAQDYLGGPLSHLDSHHGVHRIPALTPLYVELARELGVPVRGAPGTTGRQIRDMGAKASVAIVRDWTGLNLGAESLRDQVNRLAELHIDESVVEVVSHPGFNDQYLSSISSLSYAREGDHRALLELRRLGWPDCDGHYRASHTAILES